MTSGKEIFPGPTQSRTHGKVNSTQRIPTEKECHVLMARHSMLPNIVEHSLQVMRVSPAITDNLKENISINRDLIIAGSLLHDITKTRSLQTKERNIQAQLTDQDTIPCSMRPSSFSTCSIPLLEIIFSMGVFQPSAIDGDRSQPLAFSRLSKTSIHRFWTVIKAASRFL